MRVAAFMALMVAVLSIASCVAAASLADRIQTTDAIAGARG